MSDSFVLPANNGNFYVSSLCHFVTTFPTEIDVDHQARIVNLSKIQYVGTQVYNEWYQ